MNRAGIRSLEELKAKLDAHGEAKQRSLGRTSKEGLTPDDVLTFLDTWHWSFSSGWLLSTKIQKRFGESKQSQPRVKGSTLIDTLVMTILYIISGESTDRLTPNSTSILSLSHCFCSLIEPMPLMLLMIGQRSYCSYFLFVSQRFSDFLVSVNVLAGINLFWEDSQNS